MIQIVSAQKLFFFCFIFVLLGTFGKAQSGCGPGGWIPYKDEKCILIVDTVVNAEEAATICTSQDPFESSSLLSIKTEEEQLFLTQQLYETSGIIDNVWVAARRYNASTFTWTEDNSTVRYANWAPGYPSDDTEKSCVQMMSHLSKNGNKFAEGDGLWEDASCLRRNLVVCQKLQTLSAVELQRIVLDNRKRVEENEKKIAENEKKVAENQQRIEYAEKNPVPLGFIYVQLSGQPEPNEIWKNVQFTDVTSTYAGQFFRALGGDSGGFGTTQSFSSPALLVDFKEGNDVQATIEVPFGSWSPYIISGVNGDSWLAWLGQRFQFETTEVRPYNSAVSRSRMKAVNDLIKITRKSFIKKYPIKWWLHKRVISERYAARLEWQNTQHLEGGVLVGGFQGGDM